MHTVIISIYIESNDRLIIEKWIEKWIEKYMEGNGHVIIWYAILEVFWRVWGISRKISVKTVGGCV